MTESPVPLGSVVAGRYRVERVVGAGSMGTVVAARHLELDQIVAIKFVNRGELSHGDTAQRFRREVRIAARIKSEHVARVFDVGMLPNDVPFMVMEFLEGHSLDDELEARGTLPVSEAVGYVLEAVEALSEAHAAGVVHRDVKPANLFLARRGDREHLVKVLDFGVSKPTWEVGSADTSLTRTGAIVGSPLYMSPEQLRSTRSVDCRADIWALGAILFQLVSGLTPYDGESIAELCAALLRDPPRRLDRLVTNLPPGFAEVVMRCLERDPGRRFANVAELGRALLPFAPAKRIHVERARRVIALGAEAARPSIESASDMPMTLEAQLLAPASRQSELLDTKGRTVASWNADAVVERGRRTTWTAVAAFALLGVVAGLAHLASPGTSEAARAPARELAPREAAASVPLPLPATNATPPQPPASPTLPPDASVPAPAAGSSEAAAATPAPKRVAAKRWHPEPPPRAASAALRREPPQPAPTAEDAADGSKGLTDFGGRR